MRILKTVFAFAAAAALAGCQSGGDCGAKKARSASNTGAEYDVAVFVWPAFTRIRSRMQIS